MLLSTLAFIVAMTLSPQKTEEIKVNNVSAQYMHDIIKQEGRFKSDSSQTTRQQSGLVPDGITFTVTKGSNSLTAVGSDEGIRELGRIMALFDMTPSAVELEIQASVPLLKREIKTTTSIYNNTTWEYIDQSSDTKISVTPRINGDRTVTISITGGTLGHYTKVIVRVKQDQTVYLHIVPAQVKNEQTGQTERRLTVSYAIPEQKITDFFSAEKLLKNWTDWYLVDNNRLGGTEQENLTTPPEEAELLIELKVKLPISSESK